MSSNSKMEKKLSRKSFLRKMFFKDYPNIKRITKKVILEVMGDPFATHKDFYNYLGIIYGYDQLMKDARIQNMKATKFVNQQMKTKYKDMKRSSIVHFTFEFDKLFEREYNEMAKTWYDPHWYTDEQKLGGGIRSPISVSKDLKLSDALLYISKFGI